MKVLVFIFSVISFHALFSQEDSTALLYSASYTSDYATFTNSDNKIQTGLLGQIDLSLELNTESARLWNNGTFKIYLLNNHGSKPTTNTVGDIQTFSNIEAYSRTKLYEFWYQHQTTKFSFKAGMININEDYVYSETGLNLINSSFGVIPTVSANIPVSIFPNTSLGAGFIYNFSSELGVRAIITDGNPGDEISDPFGTDWTLSKEDGSITIAEVHYNLIDSTNINWGTFKIGYWFNQNTFESVQKSSFGLYTINDFALSENGDWNGFFQAGISPESFIEFSYGFGISKTGVNTDTDIFSMGYTNAMFSKENIEAESLAKGEHVIEVNYTININNNITIQPDIQYIINAGGKKDFNAFAGLIRLAVNLDN